MDTPTYTKTEDGDSITLRLTQHSDNTYDFEETVNGVYTGHTAYGFNTAEEAENWAENQGFNKKSDQQ